MGTTRALVLGATGMVGGLVLRELLSQREISTVTALVRRTTGVTDPKLVEVVHADFSDYAPAAEALRGVDCAFFCLGAYTGTMSDEAFRRVTVDYAVAFATALAAESPGAVVCFLSGQGADQTEKSRMSFARYKGAAEKALLSAGLARVHVFRPGYIHPTTPRKEPNFGYRVMRALFPLIRALYANAGVDDRDLARAMVRAALEGTPDHAGPILENRDIRALAAR